MALFKPYLRSAAHFASIVRANEIEIRMCIEFTQYFAVVNRCETTALICKGEDTEFHIDRLPHFYVYFMHSSCVHNILQK